MSERNTVKHIITTLVAIGTLFTLNFASPASAGEPFVFGEVQLTRTDTGMMPVYDMYAADSIGESRFGVQLFGAQSPGWGELLGGATVKPMNWLTLGASVGVQSLAGELEPRYALNTSVFHGHWSGFVWTEFDHNGLIGFWYDTNIRYQAIDWLQVGIRSRRFIGTGPVAWVSIPKTNFVVWGSWNPIDFETSPNAARGMGGIMYLF